MVLLLRPLGANGRASYEGERAFRLNTKLAPLPIREA
jgi:hypothetical protein